MIEHLRGSRAARLLLAALLVPVVVFSNPLTAHAAAGPWVVASVSTGLSGLQTTCKIPLRQAGPGMPALDLGSTGYCLGNPDTTPGWAQIGEAGKSYIIGVSGTTEAGNECGGLTDGTLGQHPANGTIRVAGSIQPTLISTGLADCSISEVCVHWSDGDVNDGCADVNIPALDEDQLPPNVEGCLHGTPHAVLTPEWTPNPSEPGYGWIRWWLEVDLSSLPAVSTASWGYAVHNPGEYWEGSWIGQITPGARRYSLGQTYRHEGNAPMFMRRHPLAGVEIYAGPTDGNWTRPYEDFQANLQPSTTQLPPGAGQNYYGWNDPLHCRFYFGTQLYSVEGTDGDEPQGDGIDPTPPVVDEPDEPEPEPDPVPVVEEPDTDLGWLALIWALLKSILGALTGLVQSILTGIKNLFVPSDGFLQEQLDKFSDSMEGTTLGNYADAIGNITPSSAAGCAGPTVSLPMVAAGSFTPLSACSGGMATVAAASRTIIGISFALSAGLGVIRIVGRGFGWDPTPSGGV